MTGFANLIPARGSINDLLFGDDALHIAGWILASEGPMDGLRVVVDGRELAAATTVERDDVARAFPLFPWARTSGFHCVAPFSAVAPSSWIDIAVVGDARGSPLAVMDCEVIPGYENIAADPPAHLMERVIGAAAPRAFRLEGLRTTSDLLRVLRRHRSLDTIGRLLDFGCGCGRVTRFLRSRLPRAEISGCDVDAEAVAWCSEHVDGIDFRRVDELREAYPDRSYDVVIAYSVFTHIAADEQPHWLRECARLVAPEGLLLASVQGPTAARIAGTASILDQLDRTGISDETVDSALDGVLPKGRYRSVFQDPAYTQRVWSSVLPILDYVERAGGGLQDIVVLAR